MWFKEGNQDCSGDVIQIVSSRIVYIGLDRRGQAICLLTSAGGLDNSLVFRIARGPDQKQHREHGELSSAPSPIYALAMGEGWQVKQESYSTELFLVSACKEYICNSRRLWVTAFNMSTFLNLTEILYIRKSVDTAHHTVYHQFALPLVFVLLFNVNWQGS